MSSPLGPSEQPVGVWRLRHRNSERVLSPGPPARGAGGACVDVPVSRGCAWALPGGQRDTDSGEVRAGVLEAAGGHRGARGDTEGRAPLEQTGTWGPGRQAGHRPGPRDTAGPRPVHKTLPPPPGVRASHLGLGAASRECSASSGPGRLLAHRQTGVNLRPGKMEVGGWAQSGSRRGTAGAVSQ